MCSLHNVVKLEFTDDTQSRVCMLNICSYSNIMNREGIIQILLTFHLIEKYIYSEHEP